jgi:hypothetical protein
MQTMNDLKMRQAAAVAVTVFGLSASGCGPYQALTREYYKIPTADSPSQLATITGSSDEQTDKAKPVKVFISAIDGKAVGLPKPARCNFDKRYPVTPGLRMLSLSYYVGPSYIHGQVANAEVPVNLEAGFGYIARGSYREGVAAIWVETNSGQALGERQEYPLKDNPGKGMPIGFAAISDSCSLP